MKVPASSFDFSSPHFHPNEVKHRVLHIGPNNMTLADGYKKHMALHYRALTDSDFLSEFEGFYNKLKGNKTDKAIKKTVQYLGQKAVLVPKALFDKQNAHAYIGPIFDILPNEQLLTQAIQEQFVTVFAVPNAIVNTVNQSMGEVTWTHPLATLIPAYKQKVSLQKETALFFDIQEDIVSMCAFVEGELHQQIIFPCQALNDLVYQTLRCLNTATYATAKIYVHGNSQLLESFTQTLSEKQIPVHAFTLGTTKWNNEILKTAFLSIQYHLSSCVS